MIIKTNLIEYFKTKDIEYLEYLKNNIEDLQKLREKAKEYYSKTFNQLSFNHPQNMNISKIEYVNKIYGNKRYKNEEKQLMNIATKYLTIT